MGNLLEKSREKWYNENILLPIYARDFWGRKMQQKNWIYKCNNLNRDEVLDFSKKYNLPLVMSVVFLNRGINTEEKLRAYLQKSLDVIHNPMQLPDMEEACQRIKTAIENGEKITIYGDYDADGVTATSILYLFLEEAGAVVDYYIPDRFDEGYGMNIRAVNRISKTGTKLIITVDCGITSVGEVALAKAQGMEVIITDHHTCHEKLPETMVINPKRADSEYPFESLAGVGVALKLVLGLGMMMGKKSGDIFNKYAEIAAIGTIADIVPLTDENRVIADRGLKALKNTQNYGIGALMELAGVNRENLTSTSVAFGISPRINAAGRMETAKKAVELILAKNREEGYKRALELDNLNRTRQNTERDIFNEALAKLDADVNFSKKRVIVVSGEGWHHGVIGIVAAKISEKFYKPCIMLSTENGLATGSARSTPELNIFDAIESCEELLTKFGGHAQAAGLSLAEADIPEFEKRINKYAEKILGEEEPTRKIDIDCRISAKDICIECVMALERLEPYGTENERPIFSLTGARVAGCDRIGADGKHLRLKLTSEGKFINCVGFGMGEYAEAIKDGDTVSVAFTMEINDFRGTKSVQLMLKDVKKD